MPQKKRKYTHYKNKEQRQSEIQLSTTTKRCYSMIGELHLFDIPIVVVKS